MRTIHSNYFYGNEISEYGKKWGYVDYKTLAKSFDAVLCNNITALFFADINGEFNEPELYNGSECYEDEDNDEIYKDIFQYFIISGDGAEILQIWTDEIVWYLPALDCYVWGVTHCGTSWDYVLTDIKIEENENNENY